MSRGVLLTGFKSWTTSRGGSGGKAASMFKHSCHLLPVDQIPLGTYAWLKNMAVNIDY